jgi:MFS family permease
VMTLAMIAGPLVGGYITENFSWRWIFYINMPIGGAALVYLALTMHLPRRRIPHKIDYAGAITLAIAATSIILMTTWGGTQYAWGSVQVLGLLALAIVGTAAFLYIEAHAAEPILPLNVFRNRNFSVAIAMSFLLGLVLFGALTFLPLYQQTVQHLSPTQSGLMLIPMMLGSTVTALISGQVTTKTGRYKVLPIVGAGMMTFGLYLLTGIGLHTSLVSIGIYFAVIGLGMGFLMQITTLVAQNSVAPQEMGVASSSRTFFQQIGGSLGVAAFGAVFARRLTESLVTSGLHVSTSGGQLNPATVNSLPAAIKHDVFDAIAHAVQGVFLWALPAAVAIFVLALFIKEVPLRGRAPAGETASQQPELVS